MKLIDILNKLYETTKFGADENAYLDFLESLDIEDFEKLKAYGELLIDIAESHIARRS